MSKRWYIVGAVVLALVLVVAMSATAFAAPVKSQSATHTLYAWSDGYNASSGRNQFTFDTVSGDVTGYVVDWHYNQRITWEGDLSAVKMDEGWGRVKAEVPVTVTFWTYNRVLHQWFQTGEIEDGVFSFDLAGTTPPDKVQTADGWLFQKTWDVLGEDEPWSEWTIKVPSMVNEAWELGCFGYNFHTGNDVWGEVTKSLIK